VKRRIILDTDMGSDVDDALCLALALAAPDLELVAVTHVTRDTRLRAAISRRLLDLAGRADVPVYAGSAGPLSGEQRFSWFGNEGDGILEPGNRPSAAGDALGALARLLASEDRLEVVAVGPMTNLATVLQREPALASRIARLTIMGGHVREVAYRGHVFAHGIDYNLCSDPIASEVVLNAGIPLRLVTADVTLQTWITERDLERIEASGSPLLEALGRAVRRWSPIMRQIFAGFGGMIEPDNVAFLHDPLALACVYDESFCTFEELEIEATVKDGLFRTIEHAVATPATRRMRCATAVDAERFREHFVASLLRLARESG
jgi:purine nucleosidase